MRFALVLALAGGAILMPASAQQPAEAARYSIKQDEPSTGSHLKRDITTSRLPVNKRYEELTREEREIFRSQYEHLAEADEPPFPANGLSGMYKALADAQQKLLVTGNLVMHVDVDSQGQGTAVTVIESPDPKLTQFAASVLLMERYKPAVCSGVPCKMQFPLSIQFKKRLL